ncbi:hypothetical protein PLESTM_000736000 [Pleodorina starrii]|nr:hypothetical protein PLESTM_000736000 [Pleodorina starrii]
MRASRQSASLWSFSHRSRQRRRRVSRKAANASCRWAPRLTEVPRTGVGSPPAGHQASPWSSSAQAFRGGGMHRHIAGGDMPGRRHPADGDEAPKGVQLGQDGRQGGIHRCTKLPVAQHASQDQLPQLQGTAAGGHTGRRRASERAMRTGASASQ